jgi:hypothetical protein
MRYFAACLLLAGCSQSVSQEPKPMPAIQRASNPETSAMPEMIQAVLFDRVEPIVPVGEDIFPVAVGVEVLVIHDPGGEDPAREVTISVKPDDVPEWITAKPIGSLVGKVKRYNLRPATTPPAP